MFPKFYQLIQEYCEQHSSDVDSRLYELERETYLKTLAPQMITGPTQALFLQMIIRIGNIRSVLEIGTFTGYASLAMAQALPPGGKIDTIEINKEYAYFHEKYLIPYKDKINVIWGDALQVIPELNEFYDLIYIDAGKLHYDFYLDQAIRLSKTRSIILADNVLWSGKVLNEVQDEDTRSIHQFNQRIAFSKEIEEHLILPLRDGLHMMIRS